jgi:hypothetical protein
MSEITIETGQSFSSGTVVLMAHVVDYDYNTVTSADIASGTYTIYQTLDGSLDNAVTGHEDVDLAIDDVVLDTLTNDSRWTKDNTGYNFIHAPLMNTNLPFPNRGCTYIIEYKLNPTGGGNSIIFQYYIEAI